jgi:hypothetical protein
VIREWRGICDQESENLTQRALRFLFIAEDAEKSSHALSRLHRHGVLLGVQGRALRFFTAEGAEGVDKSNLTQSIATLPRLSAREGAKCVSVGESSFTAGWPRSGRKSVTTGTVVTRIRGRTVVTRIRGRGLR